MKWKNACLFKERKKERKKLVSKNPQVFQYKLHLNLSKIKPQKHLFARFNSIFSFQNEKINSASSGYYLSCLICSSSSTLVYVFAGKTVFGDVDISNNIIRN